VNAAEVIFTDRVNDSVKIVAPPMGALAVVNFVSLNELLQTAVLLLTIASLLYRWRRPIMAMILRRRKLAEKRRNKSGDNDDEPNI
jgi:hypothetical protein